jgi:hypothetical protein
MSGGIVQLVATGAQDTWLTGKPEISFFRSNYKRYTHYALSSERQIIQGNPSAGSISTIRFEKKGDLLSYVYFIGKDTSGSLIPGVDWSKVVDKIELLIGGQVVDTQDITWMTQIEPVTGAQNYSQRYLNNDLTGLTNVINGFLPLKFFFCKDWSVALPLVALQYHDVEMRITWNQNLNYRVGYEIYGFAPAFTPTRTTGVTATTSPTIGGQVAAIALGGATTASVAAPITTSVVASSNFTVTIGATGGVAATTWQANPFQYSAASGAILPGMTFTVASQTLTVLTVSPSAPGANSGTLTGIFGSAPSATNPLPPATGLQVQSQATATTTATGTSFSPATITVGVQSYTGTLTVTAGAAAISVNSIVTTNAPTGTGASYFYVSAITFTAPTVATATITAIGPITAVGSGNFIQVGLVFTPWYPVLNMAIGAATGTVAPGQAIVGLASLQGVPTPTVNTVYSSSYITINNLNQPTLSATGDSPSTVNGYVAGVGLHYIPGKYVVGLVNATSGALVQAGPVAYQAATYTATTLNLSNFVQNGSNVYTSGAFSGLVPGSSLLFYNAYGAVASISNAYIQSGFVSSVPVAGNFSVTNIPAGTAPIVFAPGTTYSYPVVSSTTTFTVTLSQAPISGTLAVGSATSYNIPFSAFAGLINTQTPYISAVGSQTSITITIASTSIQGILPTAGYISYTAASAATAITQWTQVVVVPAVSASAQLVAAQPVEDRGGSAIISIGALIGTTPITVGQAVIGTQYAGPVTVSAVINQNVSALGTGTALIEVNFPTQSTTVNTTTGAGTLVQFVDPTPGSLGINPLVTYNNVGFNGTYQQLQYEAWCSYLYLDGAEREYFASTPMDMLITQINRVPINPLSTHEVNLAHPVKFLAFVSNSYATAYATQGTTGISAASYQFKTQLNGVDVGDTRSLFQWQDVPQYYHTPFGYKAATGTAPITIISYCLDTSKLQPTGTLNFSRLDSYRIITPSNSTLALLAGGSSGYIYAMNYNILRIQKGRGSMLYSS